MGPVMKTGDTETTSAPGAMASCFIAALGVVLSLFVLVEVNYPLLQPHARLALFALLGLLLVLVTTPFARWRRIDRLAAPVNWVLGAAAVVCFGYVVVQSEPLFSGLWTGGLSLGDRAGAESWVDFAVAIAGLLLVLECTRRCIGWTLPILAVAFLLYARFGPVLPAFLFPHRGYDWPRIAAQTFLHSQGVFGIALKVMFSYVFPFVLFGALLEQTGATGFVIDVARRLFGNSTGGPAKVAVLSSGMMGSLSGSAVANTATTGTFTIPMMRSSGFPAHVAAGIEAAASSGGALMPPVMGAGAYMMLEIIDPPVTYVQIMRAAIIPALIYYTALLLVAHLQARRSGAEQPPPELALGVVLGWARGLVFVGAFTALIGFLVAGYSPFRAVTIALVVTFVLAAFHPSTRVRVRDLPTVAMRAAEGGRTLVAAAACVGIILGVVTLTGIGARLPAVILPLAHGNLFAALFLLMLCTIVLGMGLPSAVCYLLMATLVGPVLGKLGVAPIAAHLFIFYFGMMSMVTPPVALAAYTAAAIARADVMRTSLAAFRFSLIGFALPYAFVRNPALLLLTQDEPLWLGVLPAVASLLAGTVFLAVGLTGYLGRRLGMPLRGVLIAVAFVLILTDGSAAQTWIRLGSLVLGVCACGSAWRRTERAPIAGALVAGGDV